jgi:hypothetical protein
MSEEIKLGWYRRQLGGQPIQIEVVFTAPGQAVLKSSTGSLFVWDAETIRQNYDYIGTELGEWVSPDDVKFSELPIRARFRNYDLADWYESQLAGIEIRKSGTLSYACVNCDWFSQCQVWRAKK